MHQRTVLPWIKEITLDPKHIQQLIDRRAFDEWCATTSGAKKADIEEESVDHFSSVEKKRVRDLLPKLSSLEQAVLYLRYWENKLAREIARLFGLTEGKVLSILAGSIKKLRSLYDLDLIASQMPQPKLLKGPSHS